MKEMERRKRALIAQNEQLRSECAEVWGAAERRVRLEEARLLPWRHWLYPALSLISSAGMIYLRQRGVWDRGGARFGPLISAASRAMKTRRESAAGSDFDEPR